MKKNKIKNIILIGLLLLPISVFASENKLEINSIGIMFQLFLAALASFGYILPISKAVSSRNNVKNTFIKIFLMRIIVLIILTLTYSEMVGMTVDLILIFTGVGISGILKGTRKNDTSIESIPNMIVTPIKPLTDVEKGLKCPNCSSPLVEGSNFCKTCGVKINVEEIKKISTRVPANYDNFDPMFKMDDEKMLETLINKELKKEGLDSLKNVTTKEIRNKKLLINSIMSILVFVYISLIFFHFPKATYVIGAIILIIVFILSRKVSFISALTKEIKARPSEKISNIVMTKKENLVKDYSKVIGIASLLVAVSLPLIIFQEPKIIYEKMDGGYGVRFYAYGLKNNTTATIPETHKGEKVISLRGNAFSNMPNLESVTLPDTITEIRGQAFLNDKNLKEVKLPNNLKTLGGSAFKNCTSLTSIELPNTITEIGGEAFYGASSLESIELPEGLTEIRGSTFENCTSLTSIKIPDNVTRIGGHAFHSDYALRTVTITENSKLAEIGSSAFRSCSNLLEVTIPSNTVVNERAFKESPTIVKIYGQENTTGYGY